MDCQNGVASVIIGSSLDKNSPNMQRPQKKSDGTQKWMDLLFCHWSVSIDKLRRLVPTDLEIDTFNGQAYVGLVPFKMREICPWWLPRWMGFNFYETNVRTYVKHNDEPGVYFFSLDASSRLAVLAARWGWNLPYYFARMTASNHEGKLSYTSRRPASNFECNVLFEPARFLGPSEEGTLEHFLLERYVLFTELRGRILRGQVHHQPYEVYEANVLHLEDSLLAAAGIEVQSQRPSVNHYCLGVDVEVFQ
jgi:uncharacterized protein